MLPTSRPALRLVTSLLLFGASMVPVTAAAQSGPYTFYAITPCRAFDSRGCTAPCTNGGGILTTTLTDATGLRQLRMRGVCGIPNGAAAITVNHTIISPTAPNGGVARMCPSPLGGGQTICRAMVLYGPNDLISNAGIIPLGAVANPGVDNDLQVQGLGYNYALPGFLGVFTYHWTLDVTGYFQ